MPGAKPVTKSDLAQVIGCLGLHDAPVCIHARMNSFGWMEGGSIALLDAFLSHGCTLLVPTFSDAFFIPPPVDMRPRRNGWDYRAHPAPPHISGKVYRPTTLELSRESMGALPAILLQIHGSVRGDHPLNSFAALGPLSQALIEGQSDQDVYAPLRALVAHRGWVVLMGVGLDRMTFLHFAEQEAGRNLFQRWARNRNGAPMMVAAGGCSDGFENLATSLDQLERKVKVGGSLWRVFPAAELLGVASAAIRSQPEITHCGNPACERCDDAVLGGPILA